MALGGGSEAAAVPRFLLGTGCPQITTSSTSRLTRSVADLGRRIDKYFNEEYQLLSVTDHIDTRTANGRLILNVLGSVSQWERETIVERTEASLQYLKEERRVYNHPPLGYHAVKGYLRADKEEQLIVGDILELHDKGLSMRKVANNLNSRGITGKRGGKFYASTIRAILRNNIHQKAA